MSPCFLRGRSYSEVTKLSRTRLYAVTVVMYGRLEATTFKCFAGEPIRTVSNVDSLGCVPTALKSIRKPK